MTAPEMDCRGIFDILKLCTWLFEDIDGRAPFHIVEKRSCKIVKQLMHDVVNM